MHQPLILSIVINLIIFESIHYVYVEKAYLGALLRARRQRPLSQLIPFVWLRNRRLRPAPLKLEISFGWFHHLTLLPFGIKLLEQEEQEKEEKEEEEEEEEGGATWQPSGDEIIQWYSAWSMTTPRGQNFTLLLLLLLLFLLLLLLLVLLLLLLLSTPALKQRGNRPETRQITKAWKLWEEKEKTRRGEKKRKRDEVGTSRWLFCWRKPETYNDASTIKN